MILLNSWADMTFSMKDVVWFCSLLIPLVIAYVTIYANKKRIEKLEKNTENKERIDKLEKKNDDFNKNFSKLEVQLAKMKFEIVKDVIYEVRKIFSNN